MDVAVLDQLPLFRLGVITALGGGKGLASSAELVEWLTVVTSAVLVATVDVGEDVHLEEIVATRGDQDVRVVALLTHFSVGAGARVLRAGAVCVANRDASPAELRRLVAEARDGRADLSIAVLRAALHTRHETGPPPQISDEESDWLRQLSHGVSVTQLARNYAISERMLYRKLNIVYRKLGVANRTEALMFGRDRGLI